MIYVYVSRCVCIYIYIYIYMYVYIIVMQTILTTCTHCIQMVPAPLRPPATFGAPAPPGMAYAAPPQMRPPSPRGGRMIWYCMAWYNILKHNLYTYIYIYIYTYLYIHIHVTYTILWFRPVGHVAVSRRLPPREHHVRSHALRRRERSRDVASFPTKSYYVYCYYYCYYHYY